MASHVVWGTSEQSDDSSSQSSSDSSRRWIRDDVQYLPDRSSSSDPDGASLEFHAAVAQADATTSAASSIPLRGEPAQSTRPFDTQAHSMNELLRPVMQPLGMWSKGSERHGRGDCKACHWVHSRRGCMQGVDCMFCHVPHTHNFLSKVGLNRRTYCQTFADALKERFSTQPMFDDLVGHVSCHSKYLQGQLKDLRGRERRRKPDTISC
mmetsp:Transcript_94237/g.263901  ORF Transcript_94237/g.263901 Transcript_94237/m.263901 type:complete len:209 (-) Transcript_94237:106-732(-)